MRDALEAELDEKLRPDGEGLLAHDQEEAERWRIDGERTADWCMRRLRRAQRRIKTAQDVARAEIEAINAWLERETFQMERDVRFFEGKLREWHEELLVAGERGKTIRLPAGETKITTGRTHVEIDDVDALVTWVEAHLDDPGDLLVYEARPKVQQLGQRYKAKVDVLPGDYPLVDPATGEMIPGARIVRAAPTFKAYPHDVESEDHGQRASTARGAGGQGQETLAAADEPGD